MTPAVPSGGDPRPSDPRLGKLLRWYPRAWRERYGDEFLAMVEDTLGGRRPGWRLRLGVARAGLRERGHQMLAARRLRAGADRYMSRWSMATLAGCVCGTYLYELGQPRSSSPAWQASAALDALLAIVALTGTAVLAGGVIALPAFVRFLRAGGWPKIKRRIALAASATAAAAGGLCWAVLMLDSMTPAQVNTSLAFTAVQATTTVLFAVAIGLWIRAAKATAKQLDRGPGVRAAGELLAIAISTAILTAVPVQMLWEAAIRASVVWLINGLVLLFMVGCAVRVTLRRGRRPARRLRAAVAGTGKKTAA